MDGLNILARSMSIPTSGSSGGKRFQFGNSWQYHTRSDRHSKIGCWGFLFDLLQECPLLREHIRSGKVAVGINHAMRDFVHNRKKNLDLVICRAASRDERGPSTFAQLTDSYVVSLSEDEERRLRELPEIPIGVPATVLMALEAKACMTAFSKAQPRLYDELNSSHLAIHGDAEGAIAAGLTMVNVADTFVSPIRNPWPLGSRETVVTRHRQPGDAQTIIDKIMELPRRSKQKDDGFDALAIALVNCRNDGSPVTVHTGPPAPEASEIYHYGQTIGRLAHLYATRFSSI